METEWKVKEKSGVKPESADWIPAPEGTGGFETRDLLRFFVVDLITIISLHLLMGLGFFRFLDSYVAGVIAAKITLALYLVWLIRDKREAWPETGAATAGAWRGWLGSFLLYAAAYPLILKVGDLNNALMEIVYSWAGTTYVPSPQDVLILVMGDALGTPVRIALACTVAMAGPLMEELAFRGLGMNAFQRSGGTVYAVVATSFLFGLYHFSLPLLLPLSVLGAVFAIARVLSKSLWCPVALHCLHNSLVLALVASNALF